MLGQLAALGIQPNAFGEFADRAAYDGEAAGFVFLSLDGDAGATTTAWTLFIKQTAASGDWDDGQAMEGAPGPAGEPGPQGDPGLPGAPGADGADGADGPPNTLTIGTVTSGAAADATITGTAPDQVLNLVLPKGEDGAEGAPGAAGEPLIAVIQQSGGVLAGTYPMTRYYHGAASFGHVYGEVIIGTGSADIHVLHNGVQVYGPVTVTAGAPVDAADLGLTLAVGDTVDVVLANILGTVSYVLAQIDGSA